MNTHKVNCDDAENYGVLAILYFIIYYNSPLLTSSEFVAYDYILNSNIAELPHYASTPWNYMQI